MTFERPPRRISTARVRPTSGCGGGDDVEDRLVERALLALGGRAVRELRRPAAGARRAGAGGAGASDGSQTSQHGPVGRRRRAVAEVAQDPLAPAPRALDPRPHGAVLAPARRACPPGRTCGRARARGRPTAPTTAPGDAVGRRRRRLDDAGAREVADDRAHDLLVLPREQRVDRQVEPAGAAREPPSAADGSPAPAGAHAGRHPRRRLGRPTIRRATAFSASSSTVERSMKKTCRPLSLARGEQQAARRLPVAPRAAGLLVVGLERARDALVADRPHVGLVDAHPERVGGDDDRRLAGHEAPLRLGPRVARQARRGRRSPPRPAGRRSRSASRSHSARVPA